MELDIRRPSIVIVGNWNPAIFQYNWVAKHALNIPEGTDLQASELMPLDAKKNPTELPILYIDDIGFRASNIKLEIFLNSIEDECISRAENSIVNVIQTLSHTPLGGFGVNFRFIESDPDAEILDKLKSNDGIDARYRIINESIETKIDLGQETILNFSRAPSDNMVEFNFNYHCSRLVPDDFERQISGKYAEYLEKSAGILSELYGLDEYQVVHHTLRG